MKNVLIDFPLLGTYCGFGEICGNFGRCIAKAAHPDFNVFLMVPEKFVGYLGDEVNYISVEDARRQLRNTRIDLWHSTNQLFKYRRIQRDTVQLLTVHDLNFLYEKTGLHRLRHIIRLKRRIRESDYITVISNYVKADLLKFTDLKGKPVEVIYNGVFELEKERQKKPEFIKNDDKFFFAVGQVRWRKNFQVLVPMMKFFPDRRLYICGEDNLPFAAFLRNFIASQGVGNVFVTGPVTDEERNWMYAHCEGFMMPSMLEGFGLPILEAMRMGKPVFSSKLTSLPEIGGENAFYWDNFDPENMARTVKSGLETFAERDAISRNEISYAKTFDYGEYTRKYFSLYRKLLSLDNQDPQSQPSSGNC